VAGGKPYQTSEQKKLRITGYEMFLKGAVDEGRKVSYRAIAMALGVTDATVRYWAIKDRWDDRINTALTQRTIATTRGSQAVANLLRSALYTNVQVLTKIIQDPNEKVGARIRAIREYADICIKLKVVGTDDLSNPPPTVIGGFKDTLDDGHVDGTSGNAPAEPGVLEQPDHQYNHQTGSDPLSDQHPAGSDGWPGDDEHVSPSITPSDGSHGSDDGGRSSEDADPASPR
jgi:terminase small subunit